MTQTATLLLLLSGEPTKPERALLAAFAREKRVELVAPAPTPRAIYPAYRTDLVLDIEGRLDEARTLASSLDEERALALLAAIERDLVEHPELPQAAWLLAEHHRIAADVKQSDGATAAEAAELGRSALVLEGPRAPAFGALNGPEVARGPGVRLVVRDLGARDSLEIDGVGGGAERRVEPGVHHVRVLRSDALVYAGWARLGDNVEVRLGVRPVVACSAEDLGGAEASGGTVRVPLGVECAHWLVARRRALGGLEVASCQKSACSGFTPLEARHAEPPGFPPWATVAIAGAGAVAAGLFTAWATGSFEAQPASKERTVFVYGGLR